MKLTEPAGIARGDLPGWPEMGLTMPREEFDRIRR